MDYSKFVNLYSLSKTLRFELKPLGKTLHYINEHNILYNDIHRDESYKKVKNIIDSYHRSVIDEVLDNFKLSYCNENKLNSLLEYEQYYRNHTDDKKFDTIKTNLRKAIKSRFDSTEKFKRLFSKELIKEDLLKFVDNENERRIIKEFENFTTYFTGFHENRKNIYSSEEKSTSIAYRLIHENLPKFIDNIYAFSKAVEKLPIDDISELSLNLNKYSLVDVNSIKQVFSLGYFNNVLTQRQIDIYNSIIGGFALENEQKIKGLNEYINLYNQKQENKSERLPKLKMLYKQILSDRSDISWIPDKFADDNDLLESIEKFYQNLKSNVFDQIRDLLLNMSNYDLSKIYLKNDHQLSNISQRILGGYDIIRRFLINDLQNDLQYAKIKNKEKLADKIKARKSISIAEISNSILSAEIDEKPNLISYFARLDKDFNSKDIIDEIEDAYSSIKDLLNTNCLENSNKKLNQDDNSIEKIKRLLDSIKKLQAFIKPILGNGDESDKDERFYGDFTSIWDELNKITPLYNMVRNYLTNKPYSEDKIKLNFDNSTLLNGWDLNKERDNTSVILRKNGKYFLAIMNKKWNKVMDINTLSTDGDCYEKMEYKYFKDLTTMVPKCSTQLKEVKEYFKTHSNPYILNNDNFISEFFITKEEYELNNVEYNGKKKFQKDYLKKTNDVKGYKEALTKWIKFCLRFLESYKSTTMYDLLDFQSDSKINSYESIDEFYSEIKPYLYKITFRNVSSYYIDKLVDEGKIYLFQIYNKDFSPYSKGTPNMHTLYWKTLFDADNLSNVVYKLNGEAEIFYRESSIACKVTHPANQPIKNKNKLSKKNESIFTYDLIKNKRYTDKKFLFHVPITLNFKGEGISNINSIVNENICKSKDLHIIGIDRGERHLLYISVINLNGDIIKQFSLNEIINEYNNQQYVTDYHDLLEKREGERMVARKNWKKIENIKDLKEGYLSQVVHKVCDLIIQYNAIVVLEDLNAGFKRGRQKVETSVYQKFEKMLIDKLNYYVDKRTPKNDLGGLLKPLQLTNEFKSFQNIGKQSGILFYVRAWNTSKIDPTTGFVNLFDARYETIGKAKEFFSKFKTIVYNKENNMFEFCFDYNDGFTKKAEGTRTKWTICTIGKRIETFRDATQNSNWNNREIVLTDKFKDLFSKYNIDIDSDLREEIVQQDSANFFKELLHLFKLTLQIRNSEIGTEIDYLQSPVANENGEFYNSSMCNDSLPKNADANGAYNIARKGLLIVQKIKSHQSAKNVKIDLLISDKEWLKFAQEKSYRND